MSGTSEQFFKACRSGDVDRTKKLLKNLDLSINEKIYFIEHDNMRGQCTPLGAACCNGHHDVVRILVSDSRVEVNKTPLRMACENGHLEVVNELLKHPKIDVNMVYDEYLEPAKLYWKMDHLIEIMEALIEGKKEIKGIEKLKKKHVEREHNEGERGETMEEEKGEREQNKELIKKLRNELEREKEERKKAQSKIAELEKKLMGFQKMKKEEEEEEEEEEGGETINFKVKFSFQEIEQIEKVPLNICDKKLVGKFLEKFGRKLLKEDLFKKYMIKLPGNEIIRPRGGKTLKMMFDEGEIQAGTEIRAVLTKRE